MALTVKLSQRTIDAINDIIPIDNTVGYITAGVFDKYMFDTYQATLASRDGCTYSFSSSELYTEFVLRWL